MPLTVGLNHKKITNESGAPNNGHVRPADTTNLKNPLKTKIYKDFPTKCTDNDDLLLQIENLKTFFHTEDGLIRGCDGVSYSVKKGQTLAVVGESGSGKSVTAMSILKLIPDPPGKIAGGRILFKGNDLLSFTPDEMRKIRGNEIAMIFQEPMTSLNPVMTAGEQISESLILHRGFNKKEAMSNAVELLSLVGIPAPETRAGEYPHQLSGGMRQRVMIAIALACRPDLLIADEPTSALDVTIQAQILRLIKKLQKQFGMAVILITHDMGVVAETADMVAVMYCGRIVEYGTSHDIFFSPRHPYLKGLLRSVLNIDNEEDDLYIIEGNIPDPLNLPEGCPFEPRCPEKMDICTKQRPEPFFFGNVHYACCWLHA
ncbi:oligopeptide transporter subunit; ATP-binding component of ABC superfamily [Desulfamplus magnetovallimortis]|uniref:Oligopeptide transporter subunit ATP-binding component of ABC superfamily n=1 Tax=Desulfamplus magnetovallimortis TaxID=1246637 RepID=A0A1W1HIF1_9BACT|nr:ABC transporter ATP-binding protein [Desulfamplus magnetovallimortis]SLM32220.1 oligopeptide transporter subunit; ATP-binding component of ABC superfamily [Desulfamplus magnetovallimortis]